jgi:hypothetical protein
VVQTCNSSIWEAEAEGSWVQGQAKLGYTARPWLKNKKKMKKIRWRIPEMNNF